MKEIYRRLQGKNVSFQHVCEVGVYVPEQSNIIDFIHAGIRTTLVEADPALTDKINTFYKGYPVTLHTVAMWDHNGTIKLSKAAASTFVTDLNASPAILNDHLQKETVPTFEIACKKFSEIDDGTIDLLSVDIEGSEWYVLKHMTSRPKVISVETHGKVYINPFIVEIRQWMEANGYVVWYKDNTDTVYVKGGLFTFSAFEKISLHLKDTALLLRRKRKQLFS